MESPSRNCGSARARLRLIRYSHGSRAEEKLFPEFNRARKALDILAGAGWDYDSVWRI